MRLILVHGINNQENSPKQIEEQWLSSIREGWRKLGLADKPMGNVTTAYYAKELAAAANPRANAVAMGDAAGDQSADVAYEFLKAYQEEAGISDKEIAAVAALNGVTPEAVGMGPPHEGWVIALAVGLEALLPTRGKYIAGIFLRQASVYLEKQAVTRKIDTIVRQQIFAGDASEPAIILSHSLGTVVTYRLLADNSPVGFSTPLFITMGSPLGIEIVKKRLKLLAHFPAPPIGRWINAICKDDFVTLNKTLGARQLGFDGVENDGDVLNEGPDKHDVRAYLMAPGVAKSIHDAL